MYSAYGCAHSVDSFSFRNISSLISIIGKMESPPEFCGICWLNILEITPFFEGNNNGRWIEFLQQHSIIKKEELCPKCGACCEMKTRKRKEREPKIYWACYKSYIPAGDEDFVRVKCNYLKSVTSGTWFEKVHLGFSENLILLHMYCENEFKREQAARIVHLSMKTVTDYTNFYREVFLDYCASNSSEIGGEGKVIQIDEAKFGKRKYHRGRYIDGKWIFGGIEMGSKKSFFVHVEDRSRATLLRVIKEWVAPGTTIVSDCWKAYDCLEDEGFHHLVVNHSMNFVDPSTGANTNLIERQWRDLRSILQKMGPKVDFDGHLARIMFFKKFPNVSERVHVFWTHVGKMYAK